VRRQVQKSAPHYTDAARDEVTLLAQLKAADPSGAHHCVRLLDHFEHAGPHGLHVCIVCEVLGDNLLALIKAYDYKGLPLAVVKNLARQMLVAVDYMHTRCSILHTDLKPENVMLVDTLAARRWELELPPPPPRAPAGGAGSWGASAVTAQQQQQQKAGGGGSGSGASGGGGSGDGQLSRSQKKKAKRKAKAAVSGDSGSQLQQTGGEELHGAKEELDVEQAPAGEVAAPLQQNGGCGAGNGHAAEQQPTSEQRGPGSQQAGQVADQQQQGPGQQPRRRLVYESRVLHSAADLASATAKVVDFGNACWLTKRFTDDVQTRQYRCPEVILGAR
jgi:serine/threonine-protein kinase SRPK3